jgi:hypothetical protein
MLAASPPVTFFIFTLVEPTSGTLSRFTTVTLLVR